MKRICGFVLLLLCHVSLASSIDFSSITNWFKRHKTEHIEEEYPLRSADNLTLYGLWGDIVIQSWDEKKLLLEKDSVIPEQGTPLQSSVTIKGKQIIDRKSVV